MTKSRVSVRTRVGPRRWSRAARALAAVFVAAIVFGCGTTPPPKFYVMRPLSTVEAAESGGSGEALGFGLGVGPIRLPRYLERPQIVTRSGDSELIVNDLARWGGGLEPETLRILGNNLALLLGTNRVAVYPIPGLFPIKYKVLMDVEQFDGEAGGDLILRVRWLLVSPENGETLEAKYETFTEPMTSSSFDDLVSSHSRILATFSRSIATTIRDFERDSSGSETGE